MALRFDNHWMVGDHSTPLVLVPLDDAGAVRTDLVNCLAYVYSIDAAALIVTGSSMTERSVGDGGGWSFKFSGTENDTACSFVAWLTGTDGNGDPYVSHDVYGEIRGHATS